MTTILTAAASGMVHAARVVDHASNNTANAQTFAFKSTRALGTGDPLVASENGRLGVALTASDLLMGTGNFLPDDNPLHFAIQDDAFLRMADGQGGVVYTRLGALTLDGEGNLVDPSGRFTEPRIQLPPGVTAAQVEPTGEISYTDAEGNRQVAGALSFVKFRNPQGLSQIGGGLYSEGPNTGAIIEGVPGTEPFAPLHGGVLEASNVDLARELTTVLVAQRLYQASAKVFGVGDEMLRLATDLTQ